MTTQTRILIATAAACLMGSSLAAGEPESDQGTYESVQWHPDYRSLLDMKPVLVKDEFPQLPDFPRSEEEGGAELERILQMQSDPGNGRRRLNAREELEMAPGDLLQARHIIPGPDMAPTLWYLLETMDKDVAIIGAREADRHQRLPAFKESEDILQLAGWAKTSSYPSLPYARIFTGFELVSGISDQCSDDLDLIVKDIALDMEFSGQFRRSDVLAGENLATWYKLQVMTSPSIADDLVRAETELGIFYRMNGCPLDERDAENQEVRKTVPGVIVQKTPE